jgi:hypothetical protein
MNSVKYSKETASSPCIAGVQIRPSVLSCLIVLAMLAPKPSWEEVSTLTNPTEPFDRMPILTVAE